MYQQGSRFISYQLFILLPLIFWITIVETKRFLTSGNYSANSRLVPGFITRPFYPNAGRNNFNTYSVSGHGINGRSCAQSNYFDDRERSMLRMMGGNGRIPVIGGNWKANGTVDSTAKLVQLLNDKTPQLSKQSVEVVIAAPSIHLGYVRDKLNKQSKVAAQNVGVHKGYGAYTGEMSSDMLKDFGIDWCITGHSERREGFQMPGETSKLVADKTKNAVDQGLNVIACIGEKLSDREGGNTMAVLDEQLMTLKNALSDEDWNKVVLAYEPVWAIGTGKTATPQMAQDTHKDVRNWLAKNVSPSVSSSTRIIYGGSVKGSNASDLSREGDIDGFLVGGASLNADFFNIINSVVEYSKMATANA